MKQLYNEKKNDFFKYYNRTHSTKLDLPIDFNNWTPKFDFPTSSTHKPSYHKKKMILIPLESSLVLLEMAKNRKNSIDPHLAPSLSNV